MNYNILMNNKLIFAIRNNNFVEVKNIILHFNDMNLKNFLNSYHYNLLPLIEAALYNNLEISNYLVKYGADIELAIDIATDLKIHWIINFLINLNKNKYDFKIINFKNIQENNLCSICLEEYKKEDFIIKLNCNHLFHKNCIDNAIKINDLTNCPYCRYTFI